MPGKKVIVLILSYNGKHLLDDSVTSYLANEYSNFEVVVIDNGSVDGTKEYVEEKWPQVRILRTEVNLKYSGGLNFGMKYAFDELDAEFVLITNNDVRVDKNVINACVETTEIDNMIAFVTGKVYYFDHPDTFQTVGKKSDPVLWNGGHIGKNEKDQGQYDQIKEIAWCDDIFWLVTRDVYKMTGGYDTEFAFQGEDFDWQARAKVAGFKIMYTPFAKIWHKESMTIGKTSAFKAYYDARNPLIVHMKYRSPAQFRIVLRNRFIGMLKATPRQIAKLRWNHFYKTWKGLFSALLWGFRNQKLTWLHFF